MVRDAVAVKLACTWEVAGIVTTLFRFVGTVAGAVYNPPLLIDPVPVPVTLQFTRVLLALTTVAVHCAVPSTVTSSPVPWVGVHEAVIDGDTVLAEPQELRIASAAVSPKKKRRRSQNTLSRPMWKF